MSKIKTRQSSTCPILDTLTELRNNVLPTYEDVLKCCEWERLQLKSKHGGKDPSFRDIVEKVTGNILFLWENASLPTVSKIRIVTMIKAYHMKYKNLLKSFKNRQNTPSFQENIAQFKQKSSKLFDICSCKCNEDCICVKTRLPQQKDHFWQISEKTEICLSEVLTYNLQRNYKAV